MAKEPIADAFADILEMTNEEQYSYQNGEGATDGIKNGAYN